MILHPGILALIVGSSIVLAMMVYASVIGVRILAKWDFESSSEEQLTLERKTYLVSTLASYALGFEIVSGVLFLFTVDDLHELFVGAMCATGSLNANPIGWGALVVKLLILFLSPIWIAFNHFDQTAGDYPIIKPKYLGLLLLVPLIASGPVVAGQLSLRVSNPRSSRRAAGHCSASRARPWQVRLPACRSGP